MDWSAAFLFYFHVILCKPEHIFFPSVFFPLCLRSRNELQEEYRRTGTFSTWIESQSREGCFCARALGYRERSWSEKSLWDRVRGVELIWGETKKKRKREKEMGGIHNTAHATSRCWCPPPPTWLSTWWMKSALREWTGGSWVKADGTLRCPHSSAGVRYTKRDRWSLERGPINEYLLTCGFFHTSWNTLVNFSPAP